MRSVLVFLGVWYLTALIGCAAWFAIVEVTRWYRRHHD